MADLNSESKIQAALKRTISRADKQQSMLNIVALMAAASAAGAYAGFTTGRGLPNSLTTYAALGVPTVLSGFYFAFGEPHESSDVERISDSRVEIIELGAPETIDRIVGGCLGSFASALTTGFAYCAGYALGSITEKL